ncbi:hypothetical protein [Nocardia australiensis]|uniref:hypothetical protein n=1 Tax=Nocardia australiensis TaxID=2887191 RepID=UPI001D153B47|nr:hypothetical protein [Nocardia australiensis]
MSATSPSLPPPPSTTHGRRDTRTLKTTEIAAGIGFPGAVQALRVTRTRVNRKTRKRTRETVYAVTSLPAGDSTPQERWSPTTRAGARSTVMRTWA